MRTSNLIKTHIKKEVPIFIRSMQISTAHTNVYLLCVFPTALINVEYPLFFACKRAFHQNVELHFVKSYSFLCFCVFWYLLSTSFCFRFFTTFELDQDQSNFHKYVTLNNYHHTNSEYQKNHFISSLF